MYYSRRKLLGLAAIWAAVAVGAPARAPQRRGPFSSNPGSRDLSGQPVDDTAPKFNPQDILESKQKDIMKDVARLSEIVGQLQKHLEDNNTKYVLSLDVIRKTEEIEKLAKHIKSLVRG